ncbi:MAG TPA: hypothetical protein VM290_08830 [Gaiellaceae bacterium]|nr:hypothetical protein [Gaiellaceae bacterium]
MVVAAVLGVGAAGAPERRAPAVLEPGRSLGGLSLGANEAEVRAAWGTRFGRCRSCREQTWYFNARPFQPRGKGVEFRRGRAAALFTLWSPPGWRTPEGLALGDPEARITEVYGPLTRRECGGYYALVQPGERAVTAYYVHRGRLWAFGLVSPALPVCRR